jgi:hypothetical protein
MQTIEKREARRRFMQFVQSACITGKIIEAIYNSLLAISTILIGHYNGGPSIRGTKKPSTI